MRIALISVCESLPCDGIRLISSLLKQAGHSVRCVSLARHPPIPYEEAEIERLSGILKDVDLVMIAVYSTFSYRAVQITQFVRKKFPGMKVIWGGPHCVSAPENSLRYADGVCFGEGDQCVVEFVDKLEMGDDDYLKTPNMAFNVNGSRVVNKVLPPFRDLDRLPFYDYDLEDQFILDKDLLPITKERLRQYFTNYPFNRPTFWILTTRGCPHQCSYCNNSRYISMFGRKSIRRLSVGRFMDELEASLKLFDFFDRVGFGDDDFLVRSEKELEEFGQRYRRNIGIPFTICLSAMTFRKEKVEILLDCGLKNIQLGVQSGSQRVLDEVFNRRVPVAKTKKVIRQITPYQKTHNLDLLLDFIIDNPYETEDDIVETYQYLVDMPWGSNINVFTLCFFPGTPLYERALKDGLINPFDERSFKQFHGKRIEYQVNYPTFLVLLFTLLHRYRVIRYVPRFVLRSFGSRPLQRIVGLLPKRCHRFLVKGPARFERFFIKRPARFYYQVREATKLLRDSGS